jgi:hypothetical protein
MGWELELSPHLLRRMSDRRFDEVDLRRMLERASGYRKDVVEGRWVIDVRHRKQAWEVIVEPDRDRRLLVVITAYPVWGEEMNSSYLEVTFRRGRPLAAYLYLPRRSKDKSHRTVKADPGLVIDYNRGGTPIGIEITAPAKLSAAALNRVLRRLGLPPVTRTDLAPLRAA